MPWQNFVNPKSALAGDVVGGSGTGQALQSVSKADPHRHLPNPLEHGAGIAEQPAEVAAFAGKQAGGVRHYTVDPTYWLPDWVRQHIDQGGTPDELVQKVLERVRQNPHTDMLLEAQAIFNELGRSAEGTAAIRQRVSRDVVRHITASGRGGQEECR
jgi:hypothetical protein